LGGRVCGLVFIESTTDKPVMDVAGCFVALELLGRVRIDLAKDTTALAML